ncbi:hypothetical protein Golax_020972 [Gossypium laxum]|uniref:RNase H type-1 domain-containing protein n=1 Tax=Gossypium laxum TaxID=34288 RepID=A0A7J9AJW9_9ROSI|nr:hypothetical protein [Gossypium laxum]
MAIGKFSMRESYKHLCCPISSNQLGDDEVIWKMKIPQRVRTFLWMLVRNKILTNEERARKVAVMNSLHQLLLGQSLVGIVPRWFIWLALLKLNKDSSVPIQVGSRLMLMVLFQKNNTKATIRGAVRNSDGEWLTDFNMVTGMDEIFRIEARAIVEGMKLAWLKGYKQVEINCDNVMLIDTIYNEFASISNIAEVRLIHEWCNKDWKVMFRHVLRVSNKVAN